MPNAEGSSVRVPRRSVFFFFESYPKHPGFSFFVTIRGFGGARLLISGGPCLSPRRTMARAPLLF